MKILIVEDEKHLAEGLRFNLEADGHGSRCAYDGAEALDKATVNNYDVVCLDLNLPRVDGLEVCRRLREDRYSGGIIMLTPPSSIKERIEGLDYGADDYLVKPFAFSELAARIRAITRREGGLREPVIDTRGLELTASKDEDRIAWIRRGAAVGIIHELNGTWKFDLTIDETPTVGTVAPL